MARKRMFDRLPMAWKRLDLTYGPDGKPVPGFCERFLDVLDTGFDRSHDKATEVLTSRSVDNTPDRYLALLSSLVGQQWRSGKSHDWHRRKTASAIPRWSYRGNDVCLGDLIEEHGGGPWDVVDMASRYEVWSRQGEFGAVNNMFFDADMFHPGVYVLTLSDQVNFEEFLEDFKDIRPHGTRWYFRILTERSGTCKATCWQEIQVLLGNADRQSQVFGENFFDWKPQPIVERLQIPVQWVGGSNRRPAIWGEEFLDFQPQPAAERQITPVVWFSSLTKPAAVFGDEFLDWKPQVGCGREILSTRGRASAGGLIDLSTPIPLSWDFITLDMGTNENPLDGELFGLQLPAERIVEA